MEPSPDNKKKTKTKNNNSDENTMGPSPNKMDNLNKDLKAIEESGLKQGVIGSNNEAVDNSLKNTESHNNTNPTNVMQRND